MMAILLATVLVDPSVIPPPGLEWLTPQLVEMVERLPVLGHWVTVAFQYVGFIAAVATAAAVFFRALLRAASIFSWAIGLSGLADMIDRFERRVFPYLAYLSILNVPQSKKE